MPLSPVRVLMAAVALGLAYLAFAGYVSRPNLVQRVQDAGELTVVTRISPSTYYQTQNGTYGLEYDLAKLFADELGVELRLIVARNAAEALERVGTRVAHVAAAGLAVTEERERRFRFTEPYMSIQRQLVYRVGQAKPDSLADIDTGLLKVVAGSSHAEYLHTVRHDFPDLRWEENNDTTVDGLLYRVWSEQAGYTIADSNELTLQQRFYPELRAAFDISGPHGLAWAFSQDEDDSLYRAAAGFFERIRNDGTLAHLLEKYYGHLGRFDYVGTRTYMRHITDRLPRYRALFEQAATDFSLDWRLLAAIGYQESHWDPRAVSPTGVRGIMMLTQNTSRSLGVTNRLDPEQSIRGGAEYFAKMHGRIPDHIGEPVRTWLALAAYNVGYGHLEDARILTKRQSGDPDSWVDVKARLPLLSKPKWYRQTRYGYARGWEPVRYVENIRTYYELLVRITEPEILQVNTLPAPALDTVRPGAGGLRLGPAIESIF